MVLTLRLLASGMLVALLAWGVSAAEGQTGRPLRLALRAARTKIRTRTKTIRPSTTTGRSSYPATALTKSGSKPFPNTSMYKDPANIKWNEVCNFLQAILDSKSDSFYNVKFKGADGKWQFTPTSVKTEANRLISTFSSEGLQFYQQLHGQKASDLLDDAIKANYDLATLSDLSQRYLNTKAGHAAPFCSPRFNSNAVTTSKRPTRSNA